MGYALYYLVVGAFLVWQHLGSIGVTHRLVITKFNENIFFFVASGVVCKFAILLGLVALAMGVFRLISRKSESTPNDATKLGKSDWTLAVFFAILSVVTIL